MIIQINKNIGCLGCFLSTCLFGVLIFLVVFIFLFYGYDKKWEARSNSYEGRYYVKVLSVEYGGSIGSCDYERSIPGWGIYRHECGGLKMHAELVDQNGFLFIFPKHYDIKDIPDKVPGGPEFPPRERIESIEIINGEMFWYGEELKI